MAGVEAAMRRHTPTPYDVTAPPPLHCAPPAYFAAHSPTTNGRLEPSTSGKKIWTDRLKFGGSSKDSAREEDRRVSVTMHEYNSRHHKYGTLSGGSALSKSMKYAETWLYGSVGVKPTQPRPSLFMYPDSRPAGYAIVMCSCPEFYAGTTRSKKSSASPVCKKCGGSRRAAWDVNSPSAIRGFGTVRLPPPKLRPQLPTLVVDDLTDPYDFVRKSRLLGVSTPNLLVAPQETNRSSRAKSSSPPTLRRHRSQSPLSRHKSPDRSIVVNNSSGSVDQMQRKSILECDVNAYELISKYLKPTSRGGHERSTFQDCLPEDDEELSDNDFVVVENANTTYSRTKTRSRPAFHNITKESNKNKFDSVHRRKREMTKPNDPVMPGGISIGGQTIRIFNSRDSTSKLPGISEFVSDTDGSGSTMESLADGKSHSWFNDTETSTDSYHHPIRPMSTVSRIPSSISTPKRPPRKSKSDNTVNKKDPNRTNNPDGSLIPIYSNTASSSSNTSNPPTTGKNRVNFSLDVPNSSPNVNSRRNSSLTSSSSSSVVEIKSILKKPNTSSSIPVNMTKTKPTISSSAASTPPPPPPPLPTGSADNSPTKASNTSSPSPPLLTFNGLNSKQDGQMSVSFNKTGSAAAGGVATATSSKNFSLQSTTSSPTSNKTNSNNATARKKKQVQFKVNEKTATGSTNAATVARVDEVVDPDQVITAQLAAAGGAVPATGSAAKLPPADDSIVINRKLENDVVTASDNANDDKITTGCDVIKSNNSKEEEEKERELEIISYRENDKRDNNDNSNTAASECEVQQQEHRRLQFFGDTVEETRVVNHKIPLTPVSSPSLHRRPVRSHSSADVTRTVAEEDDVKVEGGRDEQEDQDGPRSKIRLHRSLSDRLSPGSDPRTTPFNDTMRLRMRVARRDARDSFPGDDCEKPGERRLLSPGRPRPKEPPPPPPPPPAPSSPIVVRNSTPSQVISLQVNVTSPPTSPPLSTHLKSSSTIDFIQQLSPSPSIINISTEDSLSTSLSAVRIPQQNTTPPCPPPMPPPPLEMILSTAMPPPKLPPRQIFRFTKEEIEKINQNRVRKEELRDSDSPPNHYYDEPEMTTTKLSPRSVEVTNRISITCDNETTISSWNSKRDCEFIDETDRRIPFFHAASDKTGSLERQTISITSNQTTDNRFASSASETLIKVLVPSPDTDAMTLPKEMEFFNGQNCTIVKVCSNDDNSGSSPTMRRAKAHPNRRTSIMITGNEKEPVETKLITTSVVVGGDYSAADSDKNKLTISVGGGFNKVKGDANSGGEPPSRKEYRSNIVVGAEDNKSTKTVVIFDNVAENCVKSAEEGDKKDEVVKKMEETRSKKTTTIDLKAREELDELIRQRVDPVEAVRKNLIPHVCGLPKDAAIEQKGKSGEEDKDVKESDEFRTENKQLNVNKNKSEKLSTQSSLEDEVFTAKEESNEMNSDCYVCSTQSVKTVASYYNGSSTERDKQDDEVEVRIGLEFDSADENHYEMIRDPIYEEISDTPPPLPLSPPPSTVDVDDNIPTRSIFEGATKYDILNYLVGAKERGIVIESEDDSVELRTTPNHSRISSLDLSSRVSHLSNASDSSEDSCNLLIPSTETSSITSDKVRKSSAEIERNDSGVGSETSKCSRSRWQHVPASCIRADQHHSCEDCDQPVETQVTDSGLMFAPLVCRKCAKRRAERREIITEIVETEEKYGRDLRIIQEEFYKPMLVAGLLTPEQLSAIFLNVEELIENNAALSEKLRDALEIAIDQGDEDLLTVNIGRIFVEAVPMLHAFESYCTRQGGASLLLANLEKEKELLRIFLRVSQMENSVLRRMNLNSFLMVPVQRVTKYPLLLARLYKVSPAHHVGREALREAQHKIELHLEHINSLAKDISTTKLWRRISIINGRRSSSETDMINIKLRKVAVDVLEWNHDEVRFAVEGKLLFTQPTDNNWRRGRTIKLTPINAMLVTLGKPTEDYQPDSEEPLAFPRKNGIRDATLLLLKEKSGRYGLLREPLFLDRCIVCCEADWEDYFEIQELPTKDTFIFKADDGEMTRRWYRQLQYHSQGLGAWRKRRNALANIMINGMQLRS